MTYSGHTHSGLVQCKGIDCDVLLAYKSEGLFTDVNFLVNGKNLGAHKIVLASRSDVFRAMFTSGYTESQKGVTITIEDVDYEAFDTFIEYLYTREEPLVQLCPFEMLLCADKYNVKPLLYDCDTYFIATLSKENIYEYLEIAETFHRKEIKDRAIDYFREHIVLLTHHRESWPKLKLRFDWLTDIIRSYAKFHDYKEFDMAPSHWKHCLPREMDLAPHTVMDNQLSLYANNRKYSFKLKLCISSKDSHVLGVLDLVEKNINTVRMFVYLEIVWGEELVIREKQCIRWSKICGCKTGHLDVECWRFIRSPSPTMSPGPIIFAIPKRNITDKILTVKIGLSSIRPQVVPGGVRCIPDDPLAELIDPCDAFRGYREEFGERKYFDFMWETLEPQLTADNAASTLVQMVDMEKEAEDDLELFLSKNQVLQFIKFHLIEVSNSKDWAVLKSRPEILREILLEIAQ